MALVVVGSMSFSSSKVIISDTTGTYDALTNPTGYGAPNPEFDDYARYAIIRKKNVNSVPDEVLTLDSFNPLTASSIQADRAVDGWFEANLMNILIWTAGTYPAGTIRERNGVIYEANTSTSSTPPGADWDIVADLTTIEDNETIIETIVGRVTPFDADVYWSKQVALQAQQGTLWNPDERTNKRLNDIYREIQRVYSADQLGYNTQGEFIVLRLQKLGAKRDV